MAKNLRHTPKNEAPQQNNNINIVLLGETGVGKSSSGNTILGENRFKCKKGLSAVTSISSMERAEIDGRSVSVIDTPGFYSTNLSQEELSREFARSVFLSTPGVHVFLLVMPFGRFTGHEEDILKKVKGVYGEDVLKHVILLFTYGDECTRERMEAEIDMKRLNQVVCRVVLSCQCYHVFNNKDLSNRRQVTDLLQKINRMMERNKGYYTNEIYEWAQRWPWQNLLMKRGAHK